jgi:hypothetical protein
MKNKVINMFPNNTNAPNTGVKYSKLLEQFIVINPSDETLLTNTLKARR